VPTAHLLARRFWIIGTTAAVNLGGIPTVRGSASETIPQLVVQAMVWRGEPDNTAGLLRLRHNSDRRVDPHLSLANSCVDADECGRCLSLVFDAGLSIDLVVIAIVRSHGSRCGRLG
jgi:hypothetical protein